MITLYGFGNMFPGGEGETKDLRAQWALEESGLPYRVHALDYLGGELDTPAYKALSPFSQAPALDDEGFVVAESAAVVLYVAEKSGTLMPSDVQGRTRVTQWCLAAATTLEPTLVCLDFIAIFDEEKKATRVEENATKLAHRWLGVLDGRLAERTWIATETFSAADIVLAGVLRTIRKSDLLTPHRHVRAYYDRCFARPAWERTLRQYAERMGLPVDDLR